MQRYWLVGGVIWIWERVLREVRSRHRTYISKVIQHPSNVVEIQIKKEKTTTRAGQYIFICCPEISYFQWHPFTLTRCVFSSSTYTLTLIDFFLNISVRPRKTTFRYTSALSAILPVNSPMRSAATLTKRAEKRARRVLLVAGSWARTSTHP